MAIKVDKLKTNLEQLTNFDTALETSDVKDVMDLTDTTDLTDNGKVYCCVGEKVDGSDSMYVLTSFINNKDDADRFVADYKKINPYVKVSVLESNLICKFEYSTVLQNSYVSKLKPEVFSLKSILKNDFNMNDEMIKIKLNRFKDECSDYFLWKSQNKHKEMAGYIYNVIEYAKQVYSPDKSDDEIIELLQESIEDNKTLASTLKENKSVASRQKDENKSVASRQKRTINLDKVVLQQNEGVNKSTLNPKVNEIKRASLIRETEKLGSNTIHTEKRRRTNTSRFVPDTKRGDVHITQEELSDCDQIDYDNYTVKENDPEYH